MKRLFVLFALVVLLAVPVSAYTVLNDFSFDNTSTTLTGWYRVRSTADSNWSLVTKIDFEGPLSRSNGSIGQTGSMPVYLWGDPTESNYKGWGTLSWNIPETGSSANTNGTMSLRIWENQGIVAGGLAWYLHYENTTGAGDRFTTSIPGIVMKQTADPILFNDFGFNGVTSGGGHYTVYSGSGSPTASFTCTPTSQYPDESVVCTDTSTNGPTEWYWSIDAEAMGIDGWQTSADQNFTWQSAFPGLYSVNLRATNPAGSDWENKTNYVSISENATPNNCNIPVVPGLIRSWAQCVDSQTSGAVSGCDLSLYDLEGGAWSNVTDRFDGTWCIDTYPGHHINAYGSADGYTPDPTYRLNLNANAYVVYELLMHPGYLPPAAEGKVWVYGIVNDADTGAAIEGAVFRLDASGQTPKSDTTDAAGSMHIQWVNKTQTTATASKPGYGTISKVFTTSDFGPDTVRIEIHRSIVTPTPTATTGPGGTVPTTVNPNGPVNGVYPSDYTNTQGQAIMNLLAYHGYDLVLLCIFVTMLALLGFKLGK